MTVTTSEIKAEDFIKRFDEQNGFTPSIMELKIDARSRFKNLGFPTTKNEEWKYTNLSELLKREFVRAENEMELGKNEIKSFLPKEDDAIILFFENGKFSKGFSKNGNLPKGLIAGNIKDNSTHAVVKQYLGKIAQHQNESFVALNTAMFQEGAFIYTEEKAIVEKTIHLVFVNDARSNARISYPRILVYASKNSSLKISESYYSINSVNPSFTNPVTEIFIDDNAFVEYSKNQSENANDFHIDYTGVALRKSSTLNIHTITTGGGLVRNNLKIDLQDQHGSATLNGLYIANGNSHVDNHSLVAHSSPNCYSNELYKGILDEKSRGVFNGRIFVKKDAQKTNAYQSNKNIILSDDATVNAKPQLEIYADDVKCSHGATTGQLDSEAMFYLRSRGIGENEARALLTNAFAEEIIDRISMESVRESLKEIVIQKLKKGNG